MAKQWSKDDILRWHLKALPLCTIQDQRIKVNREAREFYRAEKRKDYVNKLEEIADVYIASVALWKRYHDYAGRLMIEMIEHRRKWNEIADAVDCKMEINATRKFYKKYGEWRHEEKKQ